MSRAPAQGDALALQETLASLRRAGAWRADPARFRQLEALARRLAGQPPAVRLLLQAKLERGVADFAASCPEPLPAAGSVAAVRRTGAHAGAAAAGTPLAALNHYIRSVTAAEPATAGAQPPTELSSVRRFRRAWAASRSQQQVAQAALRKPANAGPLNSHALVLDSLELMRELSPDYLRRFLLHVESLQWLEQARGPLAPAAKGKPAKAAGRRGRK